MLNEKEQRTNAHYPLIGWCLIVLSILANAGMAHHPYINASQPEAQIGQMAQIAGLTMHVHGLLILVTLSYVWLFTLYGAARNTPSCGSEAVYLRQVDWQWLERRWLAVFSHLQWY